MYEDFIIKPALTLQNIYKTQSQEDIIKDIIPNANFKDFFSLRDESNKSASINYYNNNYYIKDFGDPNQPKAETWYQYLARKNNWDINTTEGFLLTLDWANEKYNLNLEKPNFTALNSVNLIKQYKYPHFDKSSLYDKKSDVKLEIKRTSWTNKHLNYWLQFGLTKEWLESKNIAPLSYIWITNPNKNIFKKRIDATNKLTFVYPYYRNKNGTFMYKIYSPLEEKYKWLSNINNEVVENFRFIKKHKENLIIQTSLKDIGVMEFYRENYNLFKDYDFVAPIAEGIWFGNNWEKLKKLYKNIINYGNNDFNKPDNPGINYARKWSLQYSIPYIVNPDWCKASDISDYRKYTDELKTLHLLQEIENKLNYII